MKSEKCDDLKWFNIEKLPENTIHHERHAIKKNKQGISYSEIDVEHISSNPTK